MMFIFKTYTHIYVCVWYICLILFLTVDQLDFQLTPKGQYMLFKPLTLSSNPSQRCSPIFT
ncbi:hypothetical protein Hanom_Chr16g01470261 [Helianthus anomalus]